MDRAELVAYWGAENFQRWPEESLRDVAISDASKRFMVEVGLPKHEVVSGLWSFRWNFELPRCPDVRGTRIFGISDVDLMLLEETGDGPVFFSQRSWAARGYSDSIEHITLNTSIEAFAKCMAVDHAFMHDGSTDTCPHSITFAQHKAAMDDFEDRLTAIDPAIVAREGAYWNSQIFDGRLEIGQFDNGAELEAEEDAKAAAHLDELQLGVIEEARLLEEYRLDILHRRDGRTSSVTIGGWLVRPIVRHLMAYGVPVGWWGERRP